MTHPTFTLSTSRLLLSYFDPSSDIHADFLVTLYNTPEFIASIGGTPTSITTREAARRQIETVFPTQHARNGYGTYLVSLKEGSTPIGIITLMRGEEPNRYHAPDLGFAVLPEHMRRGYAKEAAMRVIEFARRERGVKGFFGFCHPSNEASMGLFSSLGFEDRGAHPLRVFGGEVAAVWTFGRGMEGEVEEWGL